MSAATTPLTPDSANPWIVPLDILIFVLAVIAMLSVSTLSMKDYVAILDSEGPVSAFSTGVANFIGNIPLLNIEFASAKSFIALGVAAFALTTLDTSTRLARYTFQEFCMVIPA